MNRVDYPAGVAIVGACADGCVLGSGTYLEGSTCPPGLVENCFL